MIKKVKFSLAEIIFYLILLAVIVIFPLIGSFASVSGDSMYPTLHNKDYLFVSKISKINKGDIVIIKRDNESRYLVKRVIGVSGDKIKFSDDKLYVNDELSEEDYINKEEGLVYTDYSETVADDCYYVLGDNRNHSGDSRMFGDVKEEEIKGVVKCNLSSFGITRKKLYFISFVIFLVLMFSHPHKARNTE